jgi:hypothetical protein
MVTEDISKDSCLEQETLERLRRVLVDGRSWPKAILEAMARWSAPEETFKGRHYSYFIGGEAFDWLLLAERLIDTVEDLIPAHEREELLFSGRFPSAISDDEIKDLLGPDKYRGYLNYSYGVIVEEALQAAAEGEVHKRRLSNSNRYQEDFSEEAFNRIYGASKTQLLKEFQAEQQPSEGHSMTLPEIKEFTYWLFKYRFKMSEKAKIASDTRKGLRHLEEIARGSRVPVPELSG